MRPYNFFWRVTGNRPVKLPEEDPDVRAYNQYVQQHVDSIKDKIMAYSAPIVVMGDPIKLDEFSVSAVPEKSCNPFKKQQTSQEVWTDFAQDVIKQLMRDHDVRGKLTQDAEIFIHFKPDESDSSVAKGVVELRRPFVEISLEEVPKKKCTII